MIIQICGNDESAVAQTENIDFFRAGVFLDIVDKAVKLFGKSY